MNPGPTSQSRKCKRCLQPIHSRVRRCPHCGEMQGQDSRRILMYIGIIGIALAIVLVGVGLFLQGSAPDDTEPADDGGTPAQPAKPPVLDR